MRNLIEKVFLRYLSNPVLETLHDGAMMDFPQGRIAFTTDSYVIHPLFFPGGDIGKLSVCGTVNDLAMCGAEPLYLSLGLIIEEGFPVEQLEKIVASIHSTAESAGVKIVTGDTKVVDKGKGDGIYINTAGIGVLPEGIEILPSRIKEGDAIILSGDIGRHGIAIMSAREGLSFETTIESDCASLAGLVKELIDAGVEIHCMRDLTRGGLGSALVEIAESSHKDIKIIEDKIPVNPQVQGACEILGLEPLFVANEGRFICILPESEAKTALNIFHSHPLGENAKIIGEVSGVGEGIVSLKTILGVGRLIDMPSGEQLPRIC
jgi:hydrogenase expression/formation protein HypE